MKKPITTQGTFCDAPGCDKQIVEFGQRHCVTPVDLYVVVFKKGKKERVNVLAVKAGDYCCVGCLVLTFKNGVDNAQRTDLPLPFPEDAPETEPADAAPDTTPAQSMAAAAKSIFGKR